jgi:hypothetical protein
MKYELAKELYKEGSPFKSAVPVTEANMKYIDYPSLSELIKACGGNFYSLYIHGKDKWQVSSSSDQWDTEIAHGSTPEEAVSRLWLELNKK